MKRPFVAARASDVSRPASGGRRPDRLRSGVREAGGSFVPTAEVYVGNSPDPSRSGCFGDSDGPLVVPVEIGAAIGVRSPAANPDPIATRVRRR